MTSDRHHHIIDVIDLTKETHVERSKIGNRKRRRQSDGDGVDSTRKETPMDVAVSLERLSLFRSKVCHAFMNFRQRSMSVKQLTEVVNTNNSEIFSQSEIDAALGQMTDMNQVMVSEGFVYLI